MINIQQLSHEIGIGTDALRIWERRYGFPIPERDRRGHRIYSSDQLEKLRVVKKLLNLGLRPGRIFALTPDQRQSLLQSLVQKQTSDSQQLRLLAANAASVDVAQDLRLTLKTNGLTEFILGTAVPLIKMLGLGWVDGSISIAREHLVSDLLEEVITQEMERKIQLTQNASVLFLTLSGERHKLGLLMAAALFQNQGINCQMIGEDLPANEVPQLAEDLQADGVAVSFSLHVPAALAKKELVTLRGLLPAPIKLIAGGEGISTSAYLPGIRICTDLDQIPALCQTEFGPWRRRVK